MNTFIFYFEQKYNFNKHLSDGQKSNEQRIQNVTEMFGTLFYRMLQRYLGLFSTECYRDIWDSFLQIATEIFGTLFYRMLQRCL